KKARLSLNLIVILDVILTVCTIVSAYAWINSRRRLNQSLSIIRVYKHDVNCVLQLEWIERHFKSYGKFKKNKNVSIEEMVAMFLHILAHHHKNRVVVSKDQEKLLANIFMNV
ncbi:hypothetical protein G4B88_016009, partial [Cannabis sativa]